MAWNSFSTAIAVVARLVKGLQPAVFTGLLALFSCVVPNALIQQRLKSLSTLTQPGSSCFDEMHFIIHFYRPDAQIPLQCGTPAAFPEGNHQLLYQVPPRPTPAFSDRRMHTTGDLLAGYGQPSGAAPLPGHDQSCFDETVSAANLPNLDLQQLLGQQAQPRQRQRRQRQQLHQPPIMRNGNNLCYAVSAFHLLEFVKVNIRSPFTLCNHYSLFNLTRHRKTSM